MIHLDYFSCFYSMFSAPQNIQLRISIKQYIDEGFFFFFFFYHGHHFNSLYVYNLQAVRAYVADLLSFLQQISRVNVS